MAIPGSCLCGSLRYEIDGPLTSMLHCHCSRCRRQHGAPFATFVSTPMKALRWLQGEDAVRSHAAAPGGPRHFCGTCGATAPSTHPEMGLAFVPAGNLEGELGITPQMHVFTGSKASWYQITDALPQHEQYPPEFGDMPTVPDREPTASAAAAAGGCLCGAVAFEIDSAPLMMFQCHCSRCRKGRSAAHGANAFYKANDFRWLRGEQLVREYKVPEARFFTVAFCGQCGASLPKVAPERGFVTVPISSLDTDPGMRPMAHIYADSRAPWFEITGPLPQYPEGPPALSPSR